MAKSARIKSALDQSPSHLMHRALQLALDIYTEETSANDLTQRQFAVLEAVSKRTGLSQSDLVRATGIDRSTLADLVARMSTKGLLERERSNLDARAMVVSLTEAGQTVLDAARPQVDQADKRILALLPKSKRDSFMELLTHLACAADAGPEQARIEAKAAKRAAKETRKAERAARKASETPLKGEKKKKSKKAAKIKASDPALIPS